MQAILSCFCPSVFLTFSKHLPPRRHQHACTLNKAPLGTVAILLGTCFPSALLCTAYQTECKRTTSADALVSSLNFVPCLSHVPSDYKLGTITSLSTSPGQSPFQNPTQGITSDFSLNFCRFCFTEVELCLLFSSLTVTNFKMTQYR